MGGFYYFVPENPIEKLTGKLLPDVLKKYELAEVFGDSIRTPDQVIPFEVRRGPGGGPGFILYLKPPSEEMLPSGYGGYTPEKQTWEQFGDTWIGYDTERRPTCEHLQRSESIEGPIQIHDSDGGLWVFPIIGLPENVTRSTIPLDVSFDKDGDIEYLVKKEHQKLWDLSGLIRDALLGVEERDSKWMLEAAITILQYNYRLGWREEYMLKKSGLRLLDSEKITMLLALSTQVHVLIEEYEEKKAESEGTSAATSPSLLPGEEELLSKVTNPAVGQ